MPRRELSINCNSKLPFVQKSVIHNNILLWIPYACNLLIKRLWGTLSKAFSESIYMQSICLPESKFDVHSSVILSNCKTVDLPFNLKTHTAYCWKNHCLEKISVSFSYPKDSERRQKTGKRRISAAKRRLLPSERRPKVRMRKCD